MQASPASPSASPPDFDFNLPCRYFKSSFARSLSMYNGGGGGGGANDMQCKSLDFDIGQYRKISAFNGNNNHGNIECNSLECPPLPQRRQVATTAAGKNEANNNYSNSSGNAYVESDASSDETAEEDTKPPAIPARCPIVVAKSKSAGALNMQQQQQQMLAQFRHVAIAENANASGNAVGNVATAAIHGNFNRPINHNTLPPQQQQQQQQQPHQQLNGKANNANSINNNNNDGDVLSGTRAGRSRCNLSNRRNVWPTDRVDLQQQQQQKQQHHYPSQQQQQQQDENLMFAVEDDINNVDDGGNVVAIAKPPVAATRSTLTTHYAAGAKPPVAARTTPACIEQRLPAFKAHSDNSANVQMVLLQNQVDTLQWQLKQVETSNEMYRAVIEEIARFLDRYQTQKQQQRQLQQQQQISRSKSLYQVYDGNSTGEGHEQSTSSVGAFADKSIGTSSSCLRTRSTSNLIVDLKQSAIHNGNAAKSGGANMKHSSLATAVADKRSYDAINTTNNTAYTTFKDFTWRRSPKKCAESKAQAAADDLEEKLNQEAFRLSRTIHNLLNTSTRQPDLTQHRNGVSACNNTLHTKVAKPATIPTTHITPAQNNASNKVNATAAADKHNSRTVPAATNSLANATADMLFLRANNIRDSRLSLRSSTDSSVHSTTSNSSVVSTSSSSAASTSSGKVETDEDVTLHHPFHPIVLPFKQHQHPLSSATEDESGFSSISSFQDIGLPLCSTMISNGTSTPNRLSLASVKLDTASLGNGNTAPTAGLCDGEPREYACDSRNSTLKANHPGNVLGVPLQATHDMQHRWDTTTKTSYRNANKYQRFSTLSNEEASAVLWV